VDLKQVSGPVPSLNDAPSTQEKEDDEVKSVRSMTTFTGVGEREGELSEREAVWYARERERVRLDAKGVGFIQSDLTKQEALVFKGEEMRSKWLLFGERLVFDAEVCRMHGGRLVLCVLRRVPPYIHHERRLLPRWGEGTLLRRKMCALAEKFRVLREGKFVPCEDEMRDYRSLQNQRYVGFLDMRYTDYQAKTVYTEFNTHPRPVVEYVKKFDRRNKLTFRQWLRKQDVEEACVALWAQVGSLMYSLKKKQERAARDHELKGSPKSKFTLGRVIVRLRLKRERAARDYARSRGAKLFK